MKKYLFLFMIFLSGCTTVTCRTYTEEQNKNEGICVDSTIYQSLLEKGKTEDKIFG